MYNTVCFLLITSTFIIGRCDLDLVIIDNTGDIEKPISSSIIQTDEGSNFSVTCKVVNTTDDYYDGQVVWIRFRDEIIETTDQLNFNPVTLNHQGVYYCSNLNQSSKVIRLRVNSFEWSRASHKRFKRLNILHLGGSKKNSEADRAEEHYSSSANGWIYTGVVLGALAIIIIVGFLVYRLVKYLDSYTTSPEQMPEARPACHHPNCGQYCTFVRRDNSSVETNCSSFSQGAPSSPIAIISNKNVEIKNTTDMPPAYVISSYYKEKYNLPPTYNEVLNDNTNYNTQ